MRKAKTPRTDALFGVFLQDIGAIRGKHPRSFSKKYFRFDYAENEKEGYSLSIEPDSFPKAVKKEIIRAFDKRLNQDLLPAIGQLKRNRRAIKREKLSGMQTFVAMKNEIKQT
ncbi:MAG TPA: hypothetical protein VKU83_06125 [Puia sp.]|nr:hypothetical protein [Puia sp.]